MPDEGVDAGGAMREALARTARYLLAALRRASPSAESADAWRIMPVRGDVVHIRNRDVGAWATATNARRPLFGNRDYWSATNKYHEGRTGWDSRALDRAADIAAERFADEFVASVARASSLWSAGQ